MKLFSVNNTSHIVDLKTAVMLGLAPDGGLYMPTVLPTLSKNFLTSLAGLSLQEIAFELSQRFFSKSLSKSKIQDIVEKSLDFPIPLKRLDDTIFALELFHGPTLAFKDIGARFMAQLIDYFNKEEDETLYVLVATSGDTGGAVASGFLGIEGIEVILLYPSKKVSHIQEQQLTTFGQNITAIEIEGTFDDCQNMVKSAFIDPEIRKSKKLTAANSINIARLIPQSFYYFYALSQLNYIDKEILFSIPSGNLGNLTAGVLAKRMGLPISRFLAGTNINKTFPKYLDTGNFLPTSSVKTISNAMDVGNPSNFVRLKYIHNNSLEFIRKEIKGFWFNDIQNEELMRDIYKSHNYIADPHGAIGYGAIKSYNQIYKESKNISIFLETAHPVKFMDVVEPILNIKIEIPDQLKGVLEQKKQSIILDSNFSSFKSFLLNL